ncbi:MAG TPA: type II CAAX endopeptidase family protein [Blastocatellia bacterium]|jgi:hypothetical protein
MVDQLSSVKTCIACGSPLGENRAATDNLCENCSAQQLASTTPYDLQRTDDAVPLPAAPFDDYYARTELEPGQTPDPDRPHWGPVAGIGIWLFSVAAIIAVPFAALIAWYLLDRERGIAVPTFADPAAMLEYVQSPRLLLVQVYSTIIAHLVTLAFCWIVVTNLRKRPFLASLGWNWTGRSPIYWIIFSAAVVGSVLIANAIFKLFLPQAETPFDKLLNSSYQIKVAVAILATFSAPFTEEVIYRGLLFAGLRKYFGVPATILAVTIFFAGVHVLQYWGAWASLSGLTMLSLILTIVRARTKSILPCVIIHLVNNGFISLVLVFGG